MPLPSIRVLLLIAMTLGPWAFNGTAQARELGDRIPLGKALTGEACHARFTRLIKKSGQQFWDIHCAGWETPSARLTTFKSSWDGLRIILHGGAYGRVKRRSQCQAPERTEILDGIGAQVQDCVLRSGGWRSFALVASVDRHAYLADGLPTTAPLAERLIGVLSGRLAEGAGDEGTMSVAIHRIEAFVEANGRLASSDEAMLYRQLFDLCVKQNNVNSYGASNKSCREALAVQEGVLGPGHPATADALSLIALNETRLGHLDDAAILFDKAQALFDRRGYQSDEYARHLTYRSTLALEREEPEKALDLAQQSVLHWRQSGRETGGLAHALSFKSDVLRSLKRYDEALRTAEDALRIHTQTLGSHSAWATFGQLRVARALIGLGRHDEAIKTLNDSLETTRILFGTGPRLGILYGVLGRAHLEKGDARAAFQAYSRAMAIAEENREYRAALDPARLDRPFEAGLRLAQQAPAEAQAVHDALFRFAQLPQGATVARTIRRMTARMASDTPAIGDLVRRLQDAERERLDRGARLGRALSQPEKDRDPAAEAALRADIDRADARYGALEQELQAAFPAYVGLVAPRPVAAADLGAVMAPDEALVTVLPTRGRTFVAVVRQGRARVYGADLSALDLAVAVGLLRGGLDWARRGRADYDLTEAHHLYTLLLGPASDLLAGVRHLVVVPSGPLASLPPGVLVASAPPPDRHYTKVDWLAARHAISVMPNVQAFAQGRRQAKASAAPLPFVGFADPAFTGAPAGARGVADSLGAVCRADAAALAEQVRRLPPLPDTAGELKSIARFLGAGDDVVNTGARATEARVRETHLDQYRVVAFATHGLLPWDLDCQADAALALTPAGGDDGLLDTAEIVALRLDADWVLLSACNTAGGGDALGGDSLSGLARAFFFAGARNLLVSHWAVSSDSTVRLTTGIFQALAEVAAGKAEALRRSRRALIADPARAHPFHWAPFVLVGDGG